MIGWYVNGMLLPGDRMRACEAGGDDWGCGRTSDRYPFTKGLCKTHYMQRRRGRGLAPIGRDRPLAEERMCAFEACARVVSARGFCTGHYQQQKKGNTLAPLREKRANGAVKEMAKRGIIECRRCGRSKPVSEYSTRNAAGVPRPYCRPCNAEQVRLNNYKVTKEFVDLLLEFQNGCCAVCGGAHPGGRAMDIDHDHSCCPGPGSCGDCVRGLVCNNCNMHGLSWYEALPPQLRTFDLLNSYLAEPPARRLKAELALLIG